MAFREMAEQRENEAAQLDDEQIWTSIVSKFIQMDNFPLEGRVMMLLDAVGGDKEIIKNALQDCVDKLIIKDQLASKVLELLK